MLSCSFKNGHKRKISNGNLGQKAERIIWFNKLYRKFPAKEFLQQPQPQMAGQGEGCLRSRDAAHASWPERFSR